MEREQIFWKLFGKNLISFKRLKNGELLGTGLLNPLLEKIRLLRLFIMLYYQSKFYKNYSNLGMWKGKIVSNTFAPPVGSRPMFRALKNLIKSYLIGYPFPVAMTFAVTYRCQCKCVHCSAGRHLRKDRSELTTEEAKKLIDVSQDLGVTIIAFTGGEPLLREDIFELISYVDKRKALPIMFTNGLLLTNENVEKLVDAGLYSLFVSIDSPSPKEHNSLRGMPGLFESAMNGLQKIKSKGVFVGLSSYATRSATINGMYKKMYNLAQELGTKNLILFDCVPPATNLKDTSELLTPEQREEIYKFSAEIFRQKKVPPLSSSPWIENSVESYLGGMGCLAANIQYYVSAYGDVAPCDFTPLSFGNIRTETLKKIWMRMIRHPAFNHRTVFCRMQHSKFRHFYIDSIPDNAILPYSINRLPKVDYRKEKILEISKKIL
ncbi:MAG: radical SAM/SPASM domain-containing protein [Candidatus Thorarchaeota archaeon]